MFLKSNPPLTGLSIFLWQKTESSQTDANCSDVSVAPFA